MTSFVVAIDCEPGDSGSGMDLVHDVRSGVDASGIERLQGPTSEEMEAK